MKDIPAIKEALSEPKKIAITTHSNPDADALGSSLGLFHYLEAKGHDVTVITPTDYPDFLKWMPGNEKVIVFNPKEQDSAIDLLNASDVIFCLDFSHLKRIDGLGPLVENASAIIITVDHHRHPQDYSNLLLHSTEAAATAELIFDLIVAIHGKEAISEEMAACLYSGLMTDTGSFRHNNVNAKVLHTAAYLVEKGANACKVAKLIYDNNSLNRLRFLGYALWELLKIEKKTGIGYFALSKADAERFNLQSGDTEGLVNYALSIKGIKVAALFKEADEIVKISFRSVDDIAVNIFASEYFDGGGHLNAAGGCSRDNLKNTVSKFRNLVRSGKLI